MSYGFAMPMVASCQFRITAAKTFAKALLL
jgi:hypothetical protein